MYIAKSTPLHACMQADMVKTPSGPPLNSPEGADSQGRIDLVISRSDLALAVHHWGLAGEAGEPGFTLSREASVLVEVLAIMDFERQNTVLLPRASRAGALVAQALEAMQASQTQDATRERHAATRV